MTADLTRDTFRPAKHYRQVVHQQGRAAADADLNEQARLQDHRDAIEAIDVVGRIGVPKGDDFLIAATPDKKDLGVRPGRLYLDGIVAEADAGAVAVAGFTAANVATLDQLTLDGIALRAGEWLELSIPGTTTASEWRIASLDAANRRVTFQAADDPRTPFDGKGAVARRRITYVVQPDLPRPPDTAWPAAGLPSFTGATGTYLVYADVWRRYLGALEDPEVREVALGGADTAGRDKIVWQLRLQRLGDLNVTPDCNALAPDPVRGRLRARARQTAPSTNPCIIEPGAQYRRLDNQLYRVEIHQGGVLGVDAGITFKFSRENASVATAWLAATATELTVASPGRDRALGLAAGQWIELVDDERELAGTPGTLVQIDLVRGNTLVMKPGSATGTTAFTDFRGHPRIRRWDQVSAAALTVERPATNEGYLALEDGVEIRFDDGRYDTGDFWTIPARTVTGDVEWPRDLDGLPCASERHGIDHHRAQLAVVRWDGTTLDVVTDCRIQFPPLTDLHASDVKLDDDPCGKGWKTVQDAVEALCHQDDLAFHNEHLHGWGVVCGLEVECLEVSMTTGVDRPREHVVVRNGYAIDPTGTDIRIEDAEDDTLVDVGEMIVDDGLGQRDATGKLPDMSVSLWIDANRQFHLDPYDPNQKQSWQQILDGTLWADVFQHCLQNLIDFWKDQTTPQPGDGPVGPAAKRVIALINLFWQVFNPTTGAHIYLSGESNPATEGVDKEDAILRTFFEALKELLHSDTFCGMFDDIEFPDYDCYRSDIPTTAPHPSTIFGADCHRRLRLHPDRQYGYTCGSGEKINVYDLTGEKMIAATPFPVAGAEVQDVAFNASGSQIYAIAWIGDNLADTVFAVGTLAADRTITWTGNQVQCDLKLVTLATSVRRTVVYAAARGAGVYAFDPANLTPSPSPLNAFKASGHLVLAERGTRTVLYAGEHSTKPNPVDYDRVRAIDVEAPAIDVAYVLHGSANPTVFEGHDDLEIAVDAQTTELYAVMIDGNGHHHLAVWNVSQSGPDEAWIRVVPLGAPQANRLSFDHVHHTLHVTFENQNLGGRYQPGQGALEPGFHPLQIGPIAPAVQADGTRLYVLNWISHTITSIPLGIDPVSATTLEVPKLVAYRVKALIAFLKLAGKLVQYLKDCICHHLLIKCPDPGGKKVYLADISVKDGKIYQICNFHHRKYVHTFPTVEYWMSAVPILPLLKLAVEKVCCAVVDGLFDKLQPPVDPAQAPAPDHAKITQLHHLVMYAQNAKLKTKWQGQKGQFMTSFMLGKGWLAEKLSRPPAGNIGDTMAALDLQNRGLAEATASATAHGITVDKVTMVEGHTVCTVVGAAIAPAKLRAGDSIELVVNHSGRVLGANRIGGLFGCAATTRSLPHEVVGGTTTGTNTVVLGTVTERVVGAGTATGAGTGAATGVIAGPPATMMTPAMEMAPVAMAPAATVDVAGLHANLAATRELVDAQARTIADLQAKMAALEIAMRRG